MTTKNCQAANPETCRYHGQSNILTELKSQLEYAAKVNSYSQYERLADQIRVMENSFHEAEAAALADSARNLKVNGHTNENEITNRIREADNADYIIQKAFEGYQAATYEDEKQILQARLVASNNQTITNALYDLEGNLIHAKLVNVPSRYHEGTDQVWGILSSPDPESQIVKWFNPSKAKNETTAAANNRKKGYFVGTAIAPAVIKKVTHSTLSGSHSWPTIVADWRTRYDTGEITPVNNGIIDNTPEAQESAE